MSYKITNQSVLESIRIAAKNGSWQQAYQLVIDAIKNTSGQPAEGVDEAVWVWVNGAKNVNSNTGAFAHYIRNYTLYQYQLRAGAPPPNPDQLVQNASNDIARNFISDILYGGDKDGFLFTNTQFKGELPSLHGIGLIDAGGAASQVFNGPASSTRGLR